ncbi:MAG TPA: hypothetical protein PLK34_01600 [Candidatus Pacearchaeota archaeon]|nr:hypothetical protein [Candidatus Pacearchaeota archaeon]
MNKKGELVQDETVRLVLILLATGLIISGFVFLALNFSSWFKKNNVAEVKERCAHFCEQEQSYDFCQEKRELSLGRRKQLYNTCEYYSWIIAGDFAGKIDQCPDLCPENRLFESWYENSVAGEETTFYLKNLEERFNESNWEKIVFVLEDSSEGAIQKEIYSLEYDSKTNSVAKVTAVLPNKIGEWIKFYFVILDKNYHFSRVNNSLITLWNKPSESEDNLRNNPIIIAEVLKNISSSTNGISVIEYDHDLSRWQFKYKKCECGNDCGLYAEKTVEAASTYGIEDPLLLLARAIRGGCNKDFPETIGPLAKTTQEKYNSYKNGLNKDFLESCWSIGNRRYTYYKEYNSALRASWAQTEAYCSGRSTFYVEEVMYLYGRLSDLYDQKLK